MVENRPHRGTAMPPPLSNLRSGSPSIFVPQGHRILKNLEKKCIPCRIFRVDRAQAKMGSTQEPQLEYAGPLVYCTADAAGPFVLKPHSKSADVQKFLVIILVCKSSKFVHFDLADSATAESFVDVIDGVRTTFGDIKEITVDPSTMFTPLSSEGQTSSMWTVPENRQRYLQRGWKLWKGMQ